MNEDAPANQNPRILNLENCQNVFIGDNPAVHLQNSEAQGTGNSPGIDPQHEKVASVHLDKPFHVPRVRREELKRIESLFSGISDVHHEDVVKTVYLTGPPGAGKTELARQYGEQFLKSHTDSSSPLVITLNAKSEESLLKSVQDVMPKLRLSDSLEKTNQNLIDLTQKLGNYLRDYSPAWLVIVDDMFENNDFNNLFPRPGGKKWGGGQVLVTTQDNNVVPACHQFAKKLSLKEGMTKEDALALLMEISGIEVDDFAEEIIEELQSLPLALACCATYVGETRQDRASTKFGWKDYLDLYRRDVKLDSRTFSNNNIVYPLSMENAATMAVNRMSKTSDVLRLTFSFLSYCDLLPVPLNVLSHYVMENLPAQNDEQPTTRELVENEISRCTLLVHGRSRNVETIKCHQVIYHTFQRVKNTRPAEQLEIEFVKMMKSVNETLDFMDNTRKEDVLLKVLARPHVQLLVNHANEMAWNNTAEFVLLSMKNGQFLFSTSDMPEGNVVESLELLYNISLELVLSDERRCDIFANLGFYYLELDRIEDAFNFLCKAYQMTEGKSENEWLLLRCRISFNLARTYCRADSVDFAVRMMKISIDLAKKVYINEEEKIMTRFMWLASLYLSWDRFWKLGGVIEEATKFFTSCAKDCVSLTRARSLFYLAQIYLHYGIIESIFKPRWFWTHMDLALDYLRQSVIIYEKVFEEDVSSCPELADVLCLSALIKYRKEPSEARAQLDKALEICIQNDDVFAQSLIIALKKHVVNDLTWWRFLVRWIRNVRKGYLKFGPEINVLDDILEEYNSGRIAPSPRIINPMKNIRMFLVWHNYAIISLIAYLILIYM